MNHFAKLYLDEDVSVILAKVLSGRGFDVLTAKDADMLRKSDEEQLLFSTAAIPGNLFRNQLFFI